MNCSDVKRSLAKDGWAKMPFSAEMQNWAEQVLPAARRALTDPDFAEWHRNDGTWFVGVNALGNDPEGRVGSGPALPSRMLQCLAEIAGQDLPLDRGQVSAIFEGFPKQGDDSDAAFRFRRDRDGAHVDGLHLVEGKRLLREPHAFILGIPLVSVPSGASETVVWEGSQHIIRTALLERLGGQSVADWPDCDVLDVYRAARRTCFDTCPRRKITCAPGEVFLIHRLALHGISPWHAEENVGKDGRMIVFFRPELADFRVWLGTAP